MRVVHESDRVLAREVDVAETFFSRGIGLMFRRSLPDGYALVFPFESQRRRDVHTLFVFVPIDVCWICDGIVQETETLQPWGSSVSIVADTIIEFPAGTLDEVACGDRIGVG